MAVIQTLLVLDLNPCSVVVVVCFKLFSDFSWGYRGIPIFSNKIRSFVSLFLLLYSRPKWQHHFPYTHLFHKNLLLFRTMVNLQTGNLVPLHLRRLSSRSYRLHNPLSNLSARSVTCCPQSTPVLAVQPALVLCPARLITRARQDAQDSGIRPHMCL